jgi:hypothetical protein
MDPRCPVMTVATWRRRSRPWGPRGQASTETFQADAAGLVGHAFPHDIAAHIHGAQYVDLRITVAALRSARRGERHQWPRERSLPRRQSSARPPVAPTRSRRSRRPTMRRRGRCSPSGGLPGRNHDGSEVDDDEHLRPLDRRRGPFRWHRSTWRSRAVLTRPDGGLRGSHRNCAGPRPRQHEVCTQRKTGHRHVANTAIELWKSISQ